jgi:hypothetical protein
MQMNWSSLQIAAKLYLNWLHYLSFFTPGRIENYTTLFCVGDLLQEIWKVFKIILKITTKIGACITAH